MSAPTTSRLTSAGEPLRSKHLHSEPCTEQFARAIILRGCSLNPAGCAMSREQGLSGPIPFRLQSAVCRSLCFCAVDPTGCSHILIRQLLRDQVRIWPLRYPFCPQRLVGCHYHGSIRQILLSILQVHSLQVKQQMSTPGASPYQRMLTTLYTLSDNHCLHKPGLRPRLGCRQVDKVKIVLINFSCTKL